MTDFSVILKSSKLEALYLLTANTSNVQLNRLSLLSSVPTAEG